MVDKVRENRLSRAFSRLRAIKSSDDFCAFFNFYHREWREITAYLLQKVHNEVMYGVYHDLLNGPFPPSDVAPFEIWLAAIQARNTKKEEVCPCEAKSKES